MVSVVVYNSVFRCLQLDLKPPPGSPKRFQRSRYLGKRYAKFGCKGDNPQSIADIVAARDTEQNLPELKTTAPHLKMRSGVTFRCVAILVQCALRCPVRNGIDASRAKPGRVSIIGAKDHSATDLIEKFVDDSLDRGEVAVKIEMLFFNIQENC